MKIEAGKYYRTRDGRKAFVAGFSPFASVIELCRATGFIDGDGSVRGWSTDGRYWSEFGGELDLVEEWREPKTFSVTIYETGNGIHMASLATCPGWKVIARATITEGDGM
jgi:hypothetical protein